MEAETYQQPFPLWQSLEQSGSDYTPFYHSFATPEQLQQTHVQRSNTQHIHATPDPTIRNGSKKRRACNECKQQKLRCDLSTLVNPVAQSCSRCRRLGVDCRIDRSFRRERKRKTSDELEKEVDILRQELSRRSNSVQASNDGKPEDVKSSTYIPTFHQPNDVLPAGLHQMTPPDSTHGSDLLVAASTSFPDTADNIESDGRGAHIVVRGQRILGDIRLSADTIDELFRQYFAFYHPFLPILDPRVSPEQCYNSSAFLFWAVISVASRRYSGDSALLSRLSQPVTNLTWKSLQTAPHSKYVVQGLALLCTWPFPVSTSTMDVTYLWAGAMVQITIQTGLSTPLNLRDFGPHRVELNESEMHETVRAWAGCNIVAHSVSIGHGLVSPIQYDLDLVSGARSGFSTLALYPQLEFHLRIEMFRDQVSRLMTSSASDSVGLLPTHERHAVYPVLSHQIEEIEASLNQLSDLDRFYVYAARLHLHSYFLFDEPSSDSYVEHILMLYFTAASLIQHTVEASNRTASFLQYTPFFATQTFIAATFTILRIVRHEYFASLIDTELSQKLFHSAVYAIRTMSIANSDLPCRFGDILSSLWTIPACHVPNSQGKYGLQLRVRSHGSMSVVHDSLWHWRDYFHKDEAAELGEHGMLEASTTDVNTPDSFLQDAGKFGHLEYGLEEYDFGICS